MMEKLISFLLGVASSIVASATLKFLGVYYRVIPPKYRKSFDREFKNQHKALKSIKRDAEKSETLRVIAMKGDTFSNPGDSGELHDFLINGRPNKQKYLISDPDNPYVIKRGVELKNTNLKMGIQNSLGCFNEIANQNANIIIRKHKEILRFRLIIFDESLYISFQSTTSIGRLSPMQRYIKGSSGYSALEAYFEDLWAKYE